MARPERHNVDYFPFFCKEGKAMFYVEQKYGNDGYASWVKILRQLAVTNNHFLNLSNKVEIMYLSSKCKIKEDTLCELISDLCSLGEFDEVLWAENKIVYSSKFIDSVKDAYFNRKSNLYDYQGFLTMLSDLGIRQLELNPKKTPNNTQRREEKKKEDKTKRDYVISSYEQLLEKWLKYKSNRKEKYKDEDSIKSAYEKLVRISDGDPLIAERIIDESMSNNWAGLFELKDADLKKMQQDKKDPDLFNGVAPLPNNDF